jgi:hypothetical protein
MRVDACRESYQVVVTKIYVKKGDLDEIKSGLDNFFRLFRFTRSAVALGGLLMWIQKWLF